MCQYIYPDDPDDPKYDEERAGKQCQAISLKDSRFCLVPDTRIFTNKFITIKNINNKCYGSIGQIQKIKNKGKRKYKGKIMKITPMGFPSIFITPDHAWKIKQFRNEGHSPESFINRIKEPTVWINSEDLKPRDLLLIPRINKQKYDPPSFKNFILDDDSFEFFGWYVAEGHRQSNRLFISQKNKNVLLNLKNKITKYGLDSKIDSVGNTDIFRLVVQYGNTEEILNKFGDGAKNKKIPESFFCLPRHLLLSFLKGFMLGDGCFVNTGRIDLGTSSEQLAYDLVQLLLVLGYYPQLKKGTEQEKDFNGYHYSSFVYYVRICPKDSEEILKELNMFDQYLSDHDSHVNRYYKDNKYFYVPIKKVEKEKYEGLVYNLETEDNTYLLPFIVHNCYYHQSNQEKVMEQLAEAREVRQNPPNLKHGYYSKEKRECDTCTLAAGCQYFEAGKKVCDFDLNPDIDLSSLENIQTFAEEIMSSEIMTYKLLETIVKLNPENADLIELKRKYSKTIMSTLRDFSAIKDSYEKRKSGSSWEDILNPS